MIPNDARDLLEQLQKSQDRLMVAVHDSRVLMDALELAAHETRGWLQFLADAINQEMEVNRME